MTKKKKNREESEERLLDGIRSVSDLRLLDENDMPRLASEIREFLVDTTKQHGGHLASNLGVVELSLALHRVFDTPSDRVIWDVGHQSYVHKIVTGRRDSFDSLRIPGGLSGFTRREESAFDAFGTGHSSTSISAALGFAEADAIAGRDQYTVAVIGDGALTGGLAHEGINNCRRDLRLIVVLNENEMSISRVTGAFPRLVNRLRISRSYRSFKRTSRSVLRYIPLLGPAVFYTGRWVRNIIRRGLYRSNFFEEMGFTYLGPYDGNDYRQVEDALTEAKQKERCVIVHLRTKKGKGYQDAEEKPCEYHCVYPNAQGGDTYHDVFGRVLDELAAKDDTICAVTPATGETTGLSAFAAHYENRFFDVGIAEEHALTFAAGLAASGMKPYAVIYSSFLQRGYDQVLHDIALQHLPVHIIVDRASLAPADGPTHHGIYDVAFLSHIAGLPIYAPATLETLDRMMLDTVSATEPVVIRYPNGGGSARVARAFYPNEDYNDYGVRHYGNLERAKAVVISYGIAAERALEAVDTLCEEGTDTAMLLLETLAPMASIGKKISSLLHEGVCVCFLEEGIYNGGIAMQLGAYLGEHRHDVKYHACAVMDGTASPKTPTDIYSYHGIGTTDVVAAVTKMASCDAPRA